MGYSMCSERRAIKVVRVRVEETSKERRGREVAGAMLGPRVSVPAFKRSRCGLDLSCD